MKFKLLYLLLFFTTVIFAQSEVYYFKDSIGSLVYEDVVNKEFRLMEGQILEKHSHDVYWFKIPAYATDSDYIVRILYDRINNAKVYQNGQSIEKLSNQRYLSYKFSREDDVYMRLSPKLHMYIPIELAEEEVSVLKDKNLFLFNGFYYGFSFLVIIYSLGFYFLFRDDAFLYYALFLGSMSFGVFIMDGMLTYYMVSEDVNDLLMTLNYISLAFFSAKFANSYLFLDAHYPKLKKFSYVFGVLIIILGILYMILRDYYCLLLLNIAVFTLLFAYWLCTVLLFGKSFYNKILAIAYVIVLFSAIDFFVLKFLGISFINIDGTTIKIGSFLEMSLLSIAVLYRMNALKEENIHMRNEIIKFSAELENQTISKNKLELLSSREREIFNQITLIKTNKEIANELNVSVNTVKFHIKNIYEKLEIKSRKEVLTIAESAIK